MLNKWCARTGSSEEKYFSTYCRGPDGGFQCRESGSPIGFAAVEAVHKVSKRWKLVDRLMSMGRGWCGQRRPAEDGPYVIVLTMWF
jgi:hypothetical protein